MPERDGKGKIEDSPKASGFVLVRSPLLTSHKWCELGPSGRLVCRCHDVFLWCYVCFVLLCFASFFVFMLSLKPRPFFQSSFDMQAPRLPHVLLFFWRWCFFRVFLYHFRFLFVWTISTSYVRSSFRMVFFYLVTTTSWIFDISLLCENSVKNHFNQTSCHVNFFKEKSERA